MREPRRISLTGQLARLGFADAGRARDLLADRLRLDPDNDRDIAVIEAIGEAPDPELALTSLSRIVEAASAVERADLLAALRADQEFAARLLSVLGVSAALGDHLARHDADWRLLYGADAVHRPGRAELRAGLLWAVGARPGDTGPQGSPTGIAGPASYDALRLAYRRRLLQLAGRDLTGVLSLDDVAGELADLAEAALEAALAIARAELPASAVPCRLAVLGMGKCGGRELNYVSDVDVIFVAAPTDDGDGDEAAALRTATHLAAGLIRVCSQTTPEGALWQVDAALRPEGRLGPLVRTLASHRAYYERWAKTWEFQALLKARPVAGDRRLGEAYLAALTPLVWGAASRDHFVEDVQAMRRRVEAEIPSNQAERQLKLGPGGLRDVEFAVQLLQLVHGRTDESLRSAPTLTALAELSRGGYVGRDDADNLAAAYRFLRRVEHLIQLRHLRRTHLVPDDPAELRLIGRALQLRADPVGEFTTLWRRHAREVRRLHEKLFYRPLLQAVARLGGEEARLTPTAARARLEALGYADPAGALRHIEALTAGLSRRAAIQRTLLPVLLGYFADAADPDAGLLGFRQVSDALGSTPWYLRLLRDEAGAAERLARVLASSRYVADLLLRAPDAVAMLGQDVELKPKDLAALEGEAGALVRRHEEAEAAAAALRGLRRRELFRISVADLTGGLAVEEVGQALTDIAVVTVRSALEVAIRKVEVELRGPLPTRMSVIGMGRLGGQEMSYASDADVLFVHDPLPGAEERAATAAAHAVAEELRRLLALPAPDPPLVVDPGLRPEGRQGPLVRTLASYAAYYRRWSSPWESQALVRAIPVAGNAELGESFVTLADTLRFPEGGISEEAIREIRRLKARMEAERLPRGADPATHTKLGPGGLSDVEWVAQLIQLRHAFHVPELQTTQTLRALAAAAAAGVLAAADAEVLAAAWRLATRVRGAITLVRGRPADSLPADPIERSAVSQVLGYGRGGSEALLDHYRRTTRRSRAVMVRVFYGNDH